MNGALREAEVVDPSWARKERRKQLLLMAATGGALVAIAIGTVAFVLGIHNSTEITQIRHSACEVEPEGEACQTAKRESAKAESISTACIAFHQVGYACPKPGSKAASRSKGVMPSTPSKGHSQPGRHEGGPGGTDTPSHPHAPSVPDQSGGGEAPSAGPTAPSRSVPPASSSAEPAPEAEAPARTATGGLVEGVGALVEGVGTTAEEAGHGLNEVVGGVGCQLLHTC